MRKDIMIGLGAALATFAVGVAEASASCNWGRRACRAYRPPPVYNHVPPPAHGYAPTVQIYVYAPPQAPYNGNGASAIGYYYPPSAPYAYRAPPSYTYGASYYDPPAYYRNGYGDYGYAPPAYDAYRPAGVWIQIR